jgi:hypothetical protein
VLPGHTEPHNIQKQITGSFEPREEENSSIRMDFPKYPKSYKTYKIPGFEKHNNMQR